MEKIPRHAQGCTLIVFRNIPAVRKKLALRIAKLFDLPAVRKKLALRVAKLFAVKNGRRGHSNAINIDIILAYLRMGSGRSGDGCCGTVVPLLFARPKCGRLFFFSSGCHESSESFNRLSVFDRCIELNCVDMVWSVRACRPVARNARDANSAYTRKQASQTKAVCAFQWGLHCCQTLRRSSD